MSAEHQPSEETSIISLAVIKALASKEYQTITDMSERADPDLMGLADMPLKSLIPAQNDVYQTREYERSVGGRAKILKGLAMRSFEGCLYAKREPNAQIAAIVGMGIEDLGEALKRLDQR